MRAAMRMPLAGLFFFCVVQVVALYIWWSPTFIAVSRTNKCFPAWNECTQNGNSNLKSCFIQLSRSGKSNGLSDRDLMRMLLEALMHTSQTGPAQKEIPSIIDKRNASIIGDDLAGKLTVVVDHRKHFQTKSLSLEINGDVEKKNEMIKTEDFAPTVMKRRDANLSDVEGVLQEKHPIGNQIDVNKLNEISETEHRRHITDEETESSKKYQRNNVSHPVNLFNYNILINQPNICQYSNRTKLDVFLLIMMISSPKAFKQRDMLRNSSLSILNIMGKVIRNVFLLGNSGDEKVNSMVHQEAAKYGDILMGDFHDSYYNLTMKSLMGLKLASIYCPQAKYVLKTDDDVFHSMTNLISLLENAPHQRYMTGFVYKGTKPIRDRNSKWYISKEVYPRDIYPPYCCGIGYIISGDLPSKIIEVSLSLPYIFLEDVYVGLCIEKLNIVPTVNPGFFTYRRDYDYCLFKSAYIIHTKKPSKIGEYWIQQKTNPTNKTC